MGVIDGVDLGQDADAAAGRGQQGHQVVGRHPVDGQHAGVAGVDALNGLGVGQRRLDVQELDAAAELAGAVEDVLVLGHDEAVEARVGFQ